MIRFDLTADQLNKLAFHIIISHSSGWVLGLWNSGQAQKFACDIPAFLLANEVQLFVMMGLMKL